jgi:trafficking kinesin-binding protein 1
VHIGKELLGQNGTLERKVAELEAELKLAQENISQMNHDLLQKNELINILTENDDTSESVSPTATKSTPFSFDILQRKINQLEVDNRTLLSEVAQVVKETDEVEEHERRLMADLSEQLNSSNFNFESISFELERYKEENRLQNEQIINLSTRLSDTQMRLHELISENDETISVLEITKENQNLLATELREYKEKYQETFALLQETQNMLREKRKRSQPMTRSSYVPGLPMGCNPDSLQSELMESSLFSENSLDSGIHSDNGQPKPTPMFKKVFDTVKCASQSSAFKDSDMSLSSSTELISSSQPRMSCSIFSSENGKTSERPGSYSMYSSIYGSNKSEDNFLLSDSEDSSSNRYSGVPGCPGAKDLEKALNNLTSAEILARRSMLSYAPAGTYSYDDPIQSHTPESIFSNMSHSTSSMMSQYRYPKKLEIVKPLEVRKSFHSAQFA